MPGSELTDAVLVLVGGGSCCSPGFVTDMVGLLFSCPDPPVARPADASPVAAGRWSSGRVGRRTGVIRGEVI